MFSKVFIIKVSALIIAFLLFFVSCMPIDTIIPNNPKTEESLTTLSWYINFSWFSKNWGEDSVSKYITDKTNINVQYIIPIGNEYEYIQSMILSGQLPDIITLGTWESSYDDLLSNNMFSPLNVLNQEYGCDFFANIDDVVIDWHTYNNNFYSYPNSSYTLNDVQDYSNQTFLVRKDIYEAIGSPDMSTQEGFINALLLAKEKFPMVNGEELIPLGLQEFNSIGNASIEEYLQNFLAIPFEINGIVYDRFTDEEYISWLKTLNEANRMGLLPKDIFVDKRIQMEEKIANGRYFAMLYQWSDCSEQLQSINQSTPEQNYIAIDGPKNSNQDNHTLAGSSIQGWTVTGISNSSQYQEEAITLLSYLLSDDGQKLLFLGVEGDSYDIINSEIVIKPDVLKLYNLDRSSYDKIYGGGTTHWPMMNNTYANKNGYIMPDNSNITHIKEWTSKYAINFSKYNYTNFQENPEIYNAYQEDLLRKGELLPRLILAETPEEFDNLFNDYLENRDEYNYDLVLQEMQRQMVENNKKLLLE